MNAKNNADGSCLVLFLFVSFLLGGIVFLIIQFVHFITSIWQFFTEPNLLPRFIELVKGFGLCCGVVILFFVMFSFLGFIGDIFNPKYPDDSDDYHASRGF